MNNEKIIKINYLEKKYYYVLSVIFNGEINVVRRNKLMQLRNQN